MKQILLVEPNKRVASVVKDYLEQNKDISVQVAYTAQDAIFQADAHPPDLVVLELAIPMHNGFAFLHEFRSYPDWKHVPVIVHSHLDIDEAQMSKAWKSLGAKAYFYKPKTSLDMLKSSVIDTLGL